MKPTAITFFQPSARAVTIWAAAFLLGLANVHGQTPKPTAEVPFEFVHNQVVLQVKIGGKGPFTMLLDTNTDPSAIDVATARELALAVGRSGAPATGGGTETNIVYPTTLPGVEIGGVTAKQVAAATIDLGKISTRMERPIHGVLGFSFLKDRIVQIDYPNSKLRFFDASPYPRIEALRNTVNLIAMPFRQEGGAVIVDSVFINNEKMRAALDTGSSGTLTLTPYAVSLLGLDEAIASAEVGSSIGYNGEYQHKQGVLKSLRIGRFQTESIQASFWLPNTGHDQKKFEVNIGNGFFQDFVVTFDFKKRFVVLERID